MHLFVDACMYSQVMCKYISGCVLTVFLLIRLPFNQLKAFGYFVFVMVMDRLLKINKRGLQLQ